MSDALLIPAERLALTVARTQIGRGETPTPNISIVCIAALCRLIGDPLPEPADWTLP